MTKKEREVALLIIITGLFILISYLTRSHLDALKQITVINSFYGQMIFVAIVIAEVLFAPTSVIPLLPIAVNVCGLNSAIILTTFGWTAGSLGAFGISRLFGRKAISYFIADHHIEEWANILPKRELFGFLVLARIFLPIDIVSYAIGIFTNISWSSYFYATLIGSVISATLFSLGAQLPLLWQFLAGIGAIIFIVIYYERFKRNFKNLLIK